MPILKIYLGNSIISHLDAPDALDKMNETKQMWEYIKSGKYEIYLSNVTINEINKCSEPKGTNMLNLVKSVKYYYFDENEESKKLINEYLKLGKGSEMSLTT